MSDFNEINFIDIEASGLGMQSYPIEIAVYIEGKVTSWLIKPEPDWVHWDKEAERLHQITREELFLNGVSVAIVADELNSLLEHTSGLLYSDAAEWDSDWISTLYRAANTPNYFHILPISDLLQENQMAAFNAKLADLYNAPGSIRHRAYSDVEIIAKAYMSI